MTVATATEVRQLHRANRRIVELSTSDLRELWASVDATDPMQVRGMLEGTLPPLTARYGEMSSAVSAEWYDDVRRRSQVRGSFTPLLAAPVEAAAVQANARWAIGPLFAATPDIAGALSQVEGELERMVLQPGRDTITRSAGRDPQAAGWQRITGPTPCKFCAGLADRGAVYKQATVRFAAHINCNCSAAPSWDPKAPEVSVEAYEASASTSSMTEDQLREHRARTRDWLNREYPDLPG